MNNHSSMLRGPDEAWTVHPTFPRVNNILESRRAPYVAYALTAVFTLMGLNLLGQCFRSLAVDYFTCNNQTTDLGKPRSGGRIKGTCVVAGGSIGGMTVAKAMSSHFDHVIIVEPDMVLEGKRSRVGQWAQVHAFHNVVIRTLSSLFPDFRHEVEKVKGHLFQMKTANWQLGRKALPFADDMEFEELTMSRMGLEGIVRKLISKTGSDIETIQGLVTGFCPTTDGKSVDTVFIRSNDGKNFGQKVVLLVDCSGPVCAGTKWIERPRNKLNTGPADVTTSWGPVKKAHYHPNVVYSTARWKVPDEMLDQRPSIPGCPNDWSEGGLVYVVHPSPSIDPRASFIFLAEDNTVIFSTPCKGLALEDLAEDVDQFEEWITSVQMASNGERAPVWVYEVLDFARKAQKEYKIDMTFRKYKFTDCHKLRYDQTKTPDNFVAAGDSIIRINPIFGMGVSKMCSDVATLDQAMRQTEVNVCLDGTYALPPGFSRGYFQKQLPRTFWLYLLTKWYDFGSDKCKPLDPGDTLGNGTLFRWFLNGVLAAAGKDSRIADSVARVICLDCPPTDLAAPNVVGKSLVCLMKGV